MATFQLSRESRAIAGLLLLTIVGIEFGGYFMTTVVSGEVEATDFQAAFYRAGHAHAGMFVTLSLVALLLADGGNLRGRLGWLARLGVPAAAVFLPGGFFLSAIGEGRTEPNGFAVMLVIGAICLAAGVVGLGLGLLLGLRANRVPDPV